MPEQHKANEYRLHASALRKMAEESVDNDHRQSFQRAAEYYENKATDLERKARGPTA